jgi:hypothetical protein
MACAEQEGGLQRDGREERAGRAAVCRRHPNDQQRFDSDQQHLAGPRTLPDQNRAEERRAERSEKENPDEGRRVGVGTGRHHGHRKNADPDPDRDSNREDQPVKALLEPHGASIASVGSLLVCRKSWAFMVSVGTSAWAPGHLRFPRVDEAQTPARSRRRADARSAAGQQDRRPYRPPRRDLTLEVSPS